MHVQSQSKTKCDIDSQMIIKDANAYSWIGYQMTLQIRVKDSFYIHTVLLNSSKLGRNLLPSFGNNYCTDTLVQPAIIEVREGSICLCSFREPE